MGMGAGGIFGSAAGGMMGGAAEGAMMFNPYTAMASIGIGLLSGLMGGGKSWNVLSTLQKTGVLPQSNTQTLQAPPQSQAAQMPDQAVQRRQNEVSPGARAAGSTLLTGASGIQPTLLNLGKNSTLGS
jgi:hypothetical protein